jgi:hypothetical protein
MVFFTAQEDLMWMAALWDFSAGDFAKSQDWNHSVSMWESDLVKQAKLSVTGLQDMRRSKAEQQPVHCSASSSLQHTPEPSTSPEEELQDFMLIFMTAWCRRVSEGIMAHGRLLAHAWQCGHELVKHSQRLPDGTSNQFLVPKRRLQSWTQYGWQQHGRDGLAAITKFLKLNGFWSAPGLELADIAPPVVGQTTKDKTLLSNIVPRAMWKDFHTPRGV